MIEDKELGLKIAEDADEVFWTETKEKCLAGIKAAERNILLDNKMLELCNEQLELFGKTDK